VKAFVIILVGALAVVVSPLKAEAPWPGARLPLPLASELP
jgi:hypothetical protein